MESVMAQKKEKWIKLPRYLNTKELIILVDRIWNENETKYYQGEKSNDNIPTILTKNNPFSTIMDGRW